VAGSRIRFVRRTQFWCFYLKSTNPFTLKCRRSVLFAGKIRSDDVSGQPLPPAFFWLLERKNQARPCAPRPLWFFAVHVFPLFFFCQSADCLRHSFSSSSDALPGCCPAKPEAPTPSVLAFSAGKWPNPPPPPPLGRHSCDPCFPSSLKVWCFFFRSSPSNRVSLRHLATQSKFPPEMKIFFFPLQRGAPTPQNGIVQRLSGVTALSSRLIFEGVSPSNSSDFPGLYPIQWSLFLYFPSALILCTHSCTMPEPGPPR